MRRKLQLHCQTGCSKNNGIGILLKGKKLLELGAICNHQAGTEKPEQLMTGTLLVRKAHKNNVQKKQQPINQPTKQT